MKSVRIPILYHRVPEVHTSVSPTERPKWIAHSFAAYGQPSTERKDLAIEVSRSLISPSKSLFSILVLTRGQALMPSPLRLLVPRVDEQECRELPHFPFRLHFASTSGPITRDMVSDCRMGCYRELQFQMSDNGEPRKAQNRLAGRWWLDPTDTSNHTGVTVGARGAGLTGEAGVKDWDTNSESERYGRTGVGPCMQKAYATRTVFDESSCRRLFPRPD